MPVPVLIERYDTPKMAYSDLPLEVRKKYPPSQAKFAGDAIAEREGLLPISKTFLNGWRCGCAVKNTGYRCLRVANSAALGCKMHGGSQAKGTSSPQYLHGARSQYLPLRLQAQYQAAVADPDLLSLRQDLGVLEVRIGELLQRLETQESGAAWDQVQALSSKIQGAWDQKIPALIPGYLAQLQELCQGIQGTQEAWGELRAVLRDRVQVATLEHKRLQEVQGTVPIEALLTMLGHLMQRLHGILMTSLDPHQARQLMAQFQQEVLVLQQHGLQAPVLHHKAVTAPRHREPDTRRTVGYVPLSERGQVLEVLEPAPGN
jgi:hypothetical protein